MLCDAHSVSSSGALTLTLVQSSERHRSPAHPGGVIPRLRSGSRLLRGALRTMPVTLRDDGTGPRASRAAACFATGVRRPPSPRDDRDDLLLLLPDTMRETC